MEKLKFSDFVKVSHDIFTDRKQRCNDSEIVQTATPFLKEAKEKLDADDRSEFNAGSYAYSAYHNYTQKAQEEVK